jgi:uncharacterized protein YndB with AHSA1/START domain
MTKAIRQTVTIGAPPEEVYSALMDEKRHASFTGAAAAISRRVGGAISCYGGHIKGINLELKPGKRIVQAWRTRDWPAGTFSIVSFSLARKAGGRTRLAFHQVGVPARDIAAKTRGWRLHYWEPLKAFLEE